jgi:hypothetical protein
MRTKYMTNTEMSNKFIEEVTQLDMKYRKGFIKNEMEEILKFVEDIGSPQRMQERRKRYSFGQKPNHVFDIEILGVWSMIFINSFNDYKQKGIVASYNREDVEETSMQAYSLAIYYKWLEKALDQNFNIEEKPKEATLNIEQKLIALHSLGLDLRDYSNTESAKILAKILNVGSENIRKNLSNLYVGKNNVRNLNNLTKVSELFENKTFDSISNRLKKEIKEHR